MNHIPHQPPHARTIAFDRKEEASAFLLNHSSLAPEHKMKLLFQLEKLK
jgi:hypothetical protein